MKRIRRRQRKALTKGSIWTTQNSTQNVPKKLVSFKAGQKIPAGAQYLNFAIENNVPKFFFLLPETKQQDEKRSIGFRLEK